MKIIVCEWFECHKCGKLVAPGMEAWIELLEAGFCSEFYDLMCWYCKEKR